MGFYRALGKIPPKRHTAFYREDGKTLYREELYSTRGFSGIYSNRYRLRMPTRVLKMEELTPEHTPAWSDVPLQWHLFHTGRIKKNGDVFSSRQKLLWNAHCAIFTATPNQNATHFFKNAYAHEMIFVHEGQGILKTDFGNIKFGHGDYLMLPKGVVYQLHFESQTANQLFIAESSTPFDIPEHFRNDYGQLTEDAPYCERDFRPPTELSPVDQKGEFDIQIKTGDRLFKHVWDHHPFDTIGWDGYEYPYAFNIKDYAAKVGQIHLPPPVHLVFTTQHFVVCNFVPRPYDFHPQSIPAPYFHTNVDSDEVLYYVDGHFMSRAGIEKGSITLHPTGMAHGPQPGKTEESIGKKEANEWAVMIDTFAPLQIAQEVKNISDTNYSRSWLGETL